MLALAIIAAKSSKHRFPFHVGFNPTRVSELIMNLLRASHDDQKADDFAHPPLSQGRIRTYGYGRIEKTR